MFSLNQIYLLNSAKEEGKAWLEMAYEDAMEGIRRKLDDMDLFEMFRKDLFNQRDPCVILEIDRKMEMNHPLMDVQDVHKIMLENDGYEKLAEEMEDIKLSYKASDESDVIQLKLEFRPRPVVESPCMTPIPALPESDEEEIPPPRPVKRGRSCKHGDEECEVCRYQQEMRENEESTEASHLHYIPNPEDFQAEDEDEELWRKMMHGL